MQQPALCRLRVDQRRFDPVAEFLLAPAQGGDAALAGFPIAGRHVEQGLLEPIASQLFRDDFGRMLVRGEILDRLEAARGRRGKAIEKRYFLEYKAQIGGEFRHDASSQLRLTTFPCRGSKAQNRADQRNGLTITTPSIRLPSDMSSE